MRDAYVEDVKIDTEIKSLRAQIEALERKKAIFNSLDLPKRMATKMHEVMCHWNHTDGCGWHYVTGDDAWETDSAHKRYLKMATDLLDHLKLPQDTRNWPYLSKLIDILAER